MATSYTHVLTTEFVSDLAPRLCLHPEIQSVKQSSNTRFCFTTQKSQALYLPSSITFNGTITVRPIQETSQSTPASPVQPLTMTTPGLPIKPTVSSSRVGNMNSKPPVVLVIHGAWHTPVHYYPLTHALTTAGFPTVCPPLPTCSNEVPATATLHTDIAHVRGVAADLASHGYPIIALMHSYGGVVGTEALVGLGWAERAKQNQPGGVINLVYMCSFLLPVGASLCTPFGGNLPPIVIGHDDGFCEMDDPWLRFYSADVVGHPPPPANDRAAAARAALKPLSGTPATSSPNSVTHTAPDLTYLLNSLTRHPTSAQMTAITAAAYLTPGMHVTYLVCERDAALPPDAQRGMAAQAQAAGADIRIESCEGGHSPFLSMPGHVVGLVTRAWERWLEEGSRTTSSSINSTLDVGAAGGSVAATVDATA